MAIYMQINDINGNVTAKGHEKWIELESMSFSSKRNISTDPGRVSNRESTRPHISQVTIMKKLDPSSNLLFEESTSGTAKPQVTLDICSTDDTLKPYAQVVLSNVMVSSYALQAGSSEGEHPMDTVTLSFDKIEYKYTPRDASNQPQSSSVTAYDLAAASAA